MLSAKARNYYVQMNEMQKYKPPIVCKVTFDVIAASVLLGSNEISGAMQIEGEHVCLEHGNIEEGSTMNAVSIGYAAFSFHSHPLIAYCSDGCSLGYPSADDFRAWLNEAFEEIEKLNALHYTICIEGTYIVRVRPIPNEVNKNYYAKTCPRKLFQFFVRYHNRRSAKRFNPEAQINATEFCDIVNNVTWDDLGVKGMKRTVFDMIFRPHIVTYDGRRFCGSTYGCGEGIDAFYKYYINTKVEKTCESLRKCHDRDGAPGGCKTELTKLQQAREEEEYDPIVPLRDADFYYEREIYSRLIAVMGSVKTKRQRRKARLTNWKTGQGHLTYSEAYDELQLDKWCFAKEYTENPPPVFEKTRDAISELVKLVNLFGGGNTSAFGGEYMDWVKACNETEQVKQIKYIASVQPINEDLKTIHATVNSIENFDEKYKHQKQRDTANEQRELKELQRGLDETIKRVVEEGNAANAINKIFAEQEPHWISNLIEYHSKKEYGIFEMPREARFLMKDGSYVTRPTGLDGLNVPIGISKDGAECARKELFLRTDDKSKEAYDKLVIHELTHSLVKDHYFLSDNHYGMFHLGMFWLNAVCKSKSITFS